MTVYDEVEYIGNRTKKIGKDIFVGLEKIGDKTIKELKPSKKKRATLF